MKIDQDSCFTDSIPVKRLYYPCESNLKSCFVSLYPACVQQPKGLVARLSPVVLARRQQPWHNRIRTAGSHFLRLDANYPVMPKIDWVRYNTLNSGGRGCWSVMKMRQYEGIMRIWYVEFFQCPFAPHPCQLASTHESFHAAEAYWSGICEFVKKSWVEIVFLDDDRRWLAFVRPDCSLIPLPSS